MKRLISALLLICLALAAPARAEAPAKPEDIVAASEIRAVAVYSNRAKITRVAVVDVPAGAHTVVFSDLPASLLPDSLRAEGAAKASVKFGAVTQKQVMSSQLASPREAELNAKLEALQDQMSALNGEKAANEVRKTFLTNLGQQAVLRANENLAQMDLKPDQWSAAVSTLFTDMSGTMNFALQQDIKIRDLSREIAKAQAELNQMRTDQRSSYTVSVPLESDADTKLTLELSYQVPNATWRPLYDARLTTGDKGDLKLIQYGAVAQTTGEDWSGVALTLSTAQPQRGASLPDLQPMWVDAYDGARQQAFGGGAANFKSMSQNIVSATSSLEAGKNEMEQDAPAAAPAPELKKAEFTAAQIETGGFVSEYKIPGPSNILSDGTETKVMVGAFDVESKLEVHIKPQLSTDAFLVSKSKLKGDAPVLPGQVNLFRDGAYVGQSAIRLLRPGEDYDFYFGVDDQVSVKRKVLKDESKEAGVIARENILERDYATEVQNLHKTPVDVVVKETIPASKNEKVHVDMVKEATTDGYLDNSDNIKGMLYWTFPMAPQEKKELKLGWTISWPKDFSLSGL